MRTAVAALAALLAAVGPGAAAEPSLAGMFASEIMRCWNPPANAPHPERLVVSFRIGLTEDGAIAQPPQLSARPDMPANDPYVLGAIEAARRAIYTCAPYKLPRERYGEWRDITINFDPRMTMGQ